MKKPISITAISSLSALGSEPEKIWEVYKTNNHYLQQRKAANGGSWVAALPKESQELVKNLRLEDDYLDLDNSVIFALLVSRNAVKNANWKSEVNFGVNFGSSRGATTLFEKYHQTYLEKGTSETLSSPTTTLGNISSWVAQDLKSKGPDISHSITCSTGLHSLLNGVAWLQSGMSDKFLIGASEAALTPFTIAQMKALRVYSKEKDLFPCKALDLSKRQNTMVLGEGAVAVCLENEISGKTIALISGIGYATEKLEHSASISAEANCFQDSMKMALQNHDASDVDVIITHTPGTIQGDLSEIKAIEKVFGDNLPAITTNKWKLGHTFATSGLLSLEMAILMLQKQEFIPVPYLEKQKRPSKIQNILVNAVGFGGNAVSVLVSLPN
ncbi:beta-ketoacyl synthase N-terminal-like domain-containing protein [Pseudofulvibacter geojedonensis]|uniref:Beta-ketoacyl synthase N-terminal-like domain-containing protein n=1 Tax=Pseudofulvibacter geojedonensis TaxID=1123758 RepID=A0ABW3I3J8_9FLAO